MKHLLKNAVIATALLITLLPTGVRAMQHQKNTICFNDLVRRLKIEKQLRKIREANQRLFENDGGYGPIDNGATVGDVDDSVTSQDIVKLKELRKREIVAARKLIDIIRDYKFKPNNEKIAALEDALKTCDVNARNFSCEQTAVCHAARENDYEVVKYLVETWKADVNMAPVAGDTPVYCAVGSENLEMVKFLVEKGKADVNKADIYGRTPLYRAAILNKLEIVEYLVETTKADVNKANDNGITPVSRAAIHNNLEVVKYLIETGKADVNRADIHDQTPLYLTAEASNLEMVKHLVKHGADVRVLLPRDPSDAIKKYLNIADFILNRPNESVKELYKETGFSQTTLDDLFELAWERGSYETWKKLYDHDSQVFKIMVEKTTNMTFDAEPSDATRWYLQLLRIALAGKNSAILRNIITMPGLEDVQTILRAVALPGGKASIIEKADDTKLTKDIDTLRKTWMDLEDDAFKKKAYDLIGKSAAVASSGIDEDCTAKIMAYLEA